MATNYFKTFGESITNNNIKTDLDYSTDNERRDGFQRNGIIHSSIMNTVLRQCSLITTAIVDIMNDKGYLTESVGPNSNYNVFKNIYSNYLDNYFKDELGLNTANYGVGIWNNSTNQFTTKTSPDTNNVYLLGTNKSNNIDFIDFNVLHQKITVVENDDDTVDVTVTNV